MKKSILISALLLSACAGTQVVTKVNTTSAAVSSFKQGVDLSSKGDWKGAADAFAIATTEDPTLWSAWINEGIAEENLHDLKRAEEAYRHAFKVNPKEAAVPLANLLVRQNKLDEAATVLEQILKSEPENANMLSALANVYRLQKKYAAAEQAARQVILRDQRNITVIKTLGEIYADQNQADLAEIFFRNALKLSPQDAALHVQLGLLKARNQETALALLEFEEALKVDASFPAAHANIGAIALRYRDYARAYDHLKRAVQLGMTDCQTQSALAYALEGKQESKAAYELLDKTYAQCSFNTELLMTMGSLCLGSLHDSKCALEKFEKFTQKNPDLKKDHRVFRLIESLKTKNTNDTQKGG
jgi:Flp pilus assembly protein TadD